MFRKITLLCAGLLLAFSANTDPWGNEKMGEGILMALSLMVCFGYSVLTFLFMVFYIREPLNRIVFIIYRVVTALFYGLFLFSVLTYYIKYPNDVTDLNWKVWPYCLVILAGIILNMLFIRYKSRKGLKG